MLFFCMAVLTAYIIGKLKQPKVKKQPVEKVKIYEYVQERRTNTVVTPKVTYQKSDIPIVELAEIGNIFDGDANFDLFAESN